MRDLLEFHLGCESEATNYFHSSTQQELEPQSKSGRIRGCCSDPLDLLGLLGFFGIVWRVVGLLALVLRVQVLGSNYEEFLS